MSGDADSKHVVSVHADSVDDFIVAAHDEQGRPGVFVAALTDVHDDAAAELLRQNVATLRNYLAHTPAPRRGAQRAALAASFLASTLLVMSARPQAAADTADRLEVPWPHEFQVEDGICVVVDDGAPECWTYEFVAVNREPAMP